MSSYYNTPLYYSSILDGLSPTHSIAAADLSGHPLAGALHRGMPTNNSINIPHHVKTAPNGIGGYGTIDTPPPLPVHRTADDFRHGKTANGGAHVGTGRRLPNLAALYGRTSSTDSHTPLNPSDSRDSSVGPQRGGDLSAARRFIFANRSMPVESDEEDWFDRRQRIDAVDRLDEPNHLPMHHRGPIPQPISPPFHQTLQLARSQAFAMAGIGGTASDYPMDGDLMEDRPYRPVQDGKQLRLPTGDHRRTLLRPAEPEDYERYGYEVPARLLARQRTNGAPTHAQLADRLVGEALEPGLGRYMDRDVVEVARRELAEAYEMDERQLASAAFATLTDPTYLAHCGGVHPNEFSDINQYSQQSLLRPAGSSNNGSQTVANPNGTADDDLLLVTTL